MNSGFPQYLIAAYFHAPRLQAISLPDCAIQFFTVDGALRSMLRVRMKLPHYTLYLNQQVDIHSLICNLVPQVPMLNYYSPGGRSWIVREYAVCNLFHSHTVGVRSMHLWRSDEALLTYIYICIYMHIVAPSINYVVQVLPPIKHISSVGKPTIHSTLTLSSLFQNSSFSFHLTQSFFLTTHLSRELSKRSLHTGEDVASLFYQALWFKV